ncbi:MAG: lytic transglycosylase domain-containing protein [Bacteroidetes Order II. Incertae sedis bacterium]|jgi:soluble lytic murein transglycosylase-like protein|nr:lytic transglycosylase domain-containing protein [Bacteroidetes Order II. bacterium]
MKFLNFDLLSRIGIALTLWAPIVVHADEGTLGIGSIVEEAGSYFTMIEKTVTTSVNEPPQVTEVRQGHVSWPFHKTIGVASTRFRIPAFVIAAVVKCESDWDPMARSHADARGLMQVLPSTALGEFGVASHHLWDPSINVLVGTAYLRWLFDRYRGDWSSVIAAYNAGPGRVDRNSGLPRETIRYQNCVANWAAVYRQGSVGLEP